mgnify:CR=1 FL=1
MTCCLVTDIVALRVLHHLTSPTTSVSAGEVWKTVLEVEPIATTQRPSIKLLAVAALITKAPPKVPSAMPMKNRVQTLAPISTTTATITTPETPMKHLTELGELARPRALRLHWRMFPNVRARPQPLRRLRSW